ncbi:MAG: glycosyltransferase family 2 protein [Vicinamibacterales bacterium]
MDLSIIIVSFNTRDDLRNCLASLVAHPPAVRHEIIVVDNASRDGSADAADTVPGVRVIRNSANLGFAAANNVGMRLATGECLLLLNSDTIVPAGAIDRLLARLRRSPEVAVVGPRLVDGQGRAEMSFGPMLSPVTEWRQRRLVKGLAANDPVIVQQVEAMTRLEQRPDWVTGACLLVRRADAEAVGGLDERYFMYTEDADFCAAIRARGRGVLFTPEAEVTHLRGRSAATASAATRAAYERSHLAFYRKHHPLWVPLLLLMRAFGPRGAAARDTR